MRVRRGRLTPMTPCLDAVWRYFWAEWTCLDTVWGCFEAVWTCFDAVLRYFGAVKMHLAMDRSVPAEHLGDLASV